MAGVSTFICSLPISVRRPQPAQTRPGRNHSCPEPQDLLCDPSSIDFQLKHSIHLLKRQTFCLWKLEPPDHGRDDRGSEENPTHQATQILVGFVEHVWDAEIPDHPPKTIEEEGAKSQCRNPEPGDRERRAIQQGEAVVGEPAAMALQAQVGNKYNGGLA